MTPRKFNSLLESPGWREAWMGPDGKLHTGESHLAVAARILGYIGSEDQESLEEFEDDAYPRMRDDGYCHLLLDRGQSDSGHWPYYRLFVDFPNNRVTPKLLRYVKNIAIENEADELINDANARVLWRRGE